MAEIELKQCMGTEIFWGDYTELFEVDSAYKSKISF